MKRFICINNTSDGFEYPARTLTYGKTYTSLETNSKAYRIRGDDGKRRWYSEKRFKEYYFKIPVRYML